MILATMMWSFGMADRDQSDDSRTAQVQSSQVNSHRDDDDGELMGSTEGVGPTNEAAENAIRALNSQNEERNAGNGPPGGGEDEESKKAVT